MQQVKIIKKYKKLEPGMTPVVDETYAALLVKKGVAEKVGTEKKK
jgi:hypothetical protein